MSEKRVKKEKSSVQLEMENAAMALIAILSKRELPGDFWTEEERIVALGHCYELHTIIDTADYRRHVQLILQSFDQQDGGHADE